MLVLPETLLTFNTLTLFTFKYFYILLNNSYPPFKFSIETGFFILIIPGNKKILIKRPADIILLLKYKEF